MWTAALSQLPLGPSSIFFSSPLLFLPGAPDLFLITPTTTQYHTAIQQPIPISTLYFIFKLVQERVCGDEKCIDKEDMGWL